MLALFANSTLNPNTPFDWGVIIVILVSILVSLGNGIKRIIDWLVLKITAPDTRIADLVREKEERDEADRKRLVKLEGDVEQLRAELFDMHIELKKSEIARAVLQGELSALQQQLGQNINVRHFTQDETTKETK
jgi:hypothetical protein